MRVIALFIIALCVYACKEDVQEHETWFELNKFEADSLEHGQLFHLGGGLCIGKSMERGPWENGFRWIIDILSCYDSLPVDTVIPMESILKSRQGGLCFYHGCSIEPEKSFTIFMYVPKGFIDANKYNIFASKYDDSTMLYKYEKNPYWEYLIPEGMFEYLASMTKNQREEAKHKYFYKDDVFIFPRKYNEFWEELFSIAKPLKIKDENFSDKCNSKFCSTKDFLKPFDKINCIYGIEQKIIDCFHDTLVSPFYRKTKVTPKCFAKLEKLSRNHSILMYSGAFPVGDCDLGNWRYIKIDSLSREHYIKLKELVKPIPYAENP